MPGRDRDVCSPKASAIAGVDNTTHLLAVQVPATAHCTCDHLVARLAGSVRDGALRERVAFKARGARYTRKYPAGNGDKLAWTPLSWGFDEKHTSAAPWACSAETSACAPRSPRTSSMIPHARCPSPGPEKKLSKASFMDLHSIN